MVLIATDLPEPCAGDQEVRHAGKVDDDRLAPMVLPSRAAAWQSSCWKRRGEQLAQHHLLAMRIGQLDADGIAARDDGDAAESALIERAISSASAITREDLMPGAGSSS